MAHEPVHYMRVEPRLFGVLSPLAVLGIALLSLLFAVGLIAAGGWAYAILPLLLSIAAFAFYAGAGPARTLSLLEKTALTGGRRARVRVRALGASIATRARARAEVVRLRSRLRQLNAVRDELQHELGAAAYAENAERMETLKRQMSALDRRSVHLERKIEAAQENASMHLRRIRFASRRTDVIAPR